MGMSSWIMDVEEAFYDQVAKIVEDSEHITEAEERALSLSKPMVPHLDRDNIREGVAMLWNEYWSNIR